ncbi:MAG: isoprenylcysteine carboxylmethyltransferase family protein [Bryobacterales bacterium]|nr:isoprenylcysteine carboxylmethyltransferase family protein [Bryobacterales bacterium]
MSTDPLRVAAFLTYLFAWLVLAVAALIYAIPSRGAARNPSISLPALIGTVIQLCALLPVVLTLNDGPLRPVPVEQAATILFAPLAVFFFLWAQRSASKHTGTLVTTGAYRRLRHPIYLAFGCMLLASGLIVSAGLWLLLAVLIYMIGTEIRIHDEEAELTRRFAEEHAAYVRRTRWRYLPGLR